MRERLVIDGRGHEREVSMPAHTIISKPRHALGFSTFSQDIDRMKEYAKDYRSEHPWKDSVDIDIKTPHEWFGIQPWGDFHIGSHGCDYDKLEELLAGVLKHDNLHTILLGNLGDFFVPKAGPRDGFLGDIVPPQTQLFTVKKFLTEYQDSILASVNEPDHTDWVYRAS